VTDRFSDDSPDRAWSTSLHLRQQLAATAAAIAETEDWIADTLDHLARVRPHDSERLRARAAHARMFAARERAQAAIYRAHPDGIPAGGKGTP
jgi:2-oxo-4-hydroxy-4-carboxy--5-ureidoimidazoline (OHCU) decarboxylase